MARRKMASKCFTQPHSTVVNIAVNGNSSVARTFLSSPIHPSFSSHDVYVDVFRGKVLNVMSGDHEITEKVLK